MPSSASVATFLHRLPYGAASQKEQLSGAEIAIPLFTWKECCLSLGGVFGGSTDLLTVSSGYLLSVGSGVLLAVRSRDLLAVGSGDLLAVGSGVLLAVRSRDLLAVGTSNLLYVQSRDLCMWFLEICWL